MFLALSLILTGVLAFEYQSHRDRVLTQAEADAENDASVTASQLDERIDAGRETLVTAVAHPAMARHGSATQAARVDALADETDFNGVSVVNRSGYLVAIDGESRTNVSGRYLGERRYVRRALAGEAFVSDPFEAETGNTIVVLSVPIRENGTVAGTLNAAIYLSNASFFASLPAADEGDRTVTVTADGRTLYRSDPPADETVTGTATMAATGWEVTVDRDRAAVLDSVRRLLYGQTLPTGAVFLLLVACVAWLYRNDIRKVEKLAAGVAALERRQYDRGPDLGGSDEWEQLDDAFSRLSKTLAERETMLLVLNRVLRHNLRNSLTVILGRAKLIEESASDEGTRRNAAEIRAAADELGSLSEKARTTEDLLVPPSDTEAIEIDLADLARRVVGAHRVVGPDAEFHLSAPATAPVRAGPELEQAVDELVGNALAHAGKRPRIAVTVERRDGRTEIRVADDGPGIPPDEQAILLGEREISQLHHSGGLGLWLADWIASRYDGELDIDCDGGTTVTLRFESA